MLLRVNNALHVLSIFLRQPRNQHLQPLYSFDAAAAALHIKAELTSLIEADRPDSDFRQGATQDRKCLTLRKDICRMNVILVTGHDLNQGISHDCMCPFPI